ncbi:beta strand repeat-containing protein [Hoeflea sp. TYP-13]|uniref:beta strand repeat-containing protein n=1 Tax=Hoeflea sp. TYP-13 TaxID=3230023 RepID=UPI0034C5C97B
MPAITIDLTSFFASLNLNLGAIQADVENVTGVPWGAPTQPSGPTTVTTSATPDVITGNAGDGVHTGTSATFNIISAQDGDDVLIGREGLDLLFGGAGIDTTDYSYLNVGSTGTFVDLASNIAISSSSDVDILSSIENVIGTKNADILLGNALNNVFNGNGGNDLIDGRGGIDVVQFLGKAEDYTFQMLDPSDPSSGFAVTGPNGPTGSVNTTVVIGIELVQFNDASAGGGISLFSIENSAIAVDDVFDISEGNAGDTFANLDVLGNDQVLEMAINNVLNGLIVGSTIDGSGQIVGGTVVDDPMDAGYPVAGAYGELTIDIAAGTVTYEMNAAGDALNAGDEVTETFYYEVVGGDRAQITINITGTNDAPQVAAALTAAADEDDASFNVDLLDGATDADAGETATLSVANVTGLTAGVTLSGTTLTVDPSDAAFQSLAAGQDQIIVVGYDVVDAQGASVPQTATITITGTNDAPQVAAALTAAADEDDASFNVDLLDGATDADAGETATLSVANVTGLTAGVTLSGTTLTVDPSDAAFQSLAAGQDQIIVVGYDVVDAQGASVPQTATITITGTNDNPVVITPQTVPAEVHEVVDDGAGESTATLSTGGVITVTDVDSDFVDGGGLPAAITVGASPVYTYNPAIPGQDLPDTILNAVFLSIDDVVSTPGSHVAEISYTFRVEDGAIEFLGEGDTLTIEYMVEISDGDGGSVQTPVTIVVNGKNDAPEITTPAPIEITLSETPNSVGPQDISVAGSITVEDLDIGDTLTASVSNGSAVYSGGSVPAGLEALLLDPANFTFNPTETNGGNVLINYNVTGAELDFLGAGETLTVTFDVKVNDGLADSNSVPVEITINGTNDDPTVSDIMVGDPSQADASSVTADASGNVYEDCGIHGNHPAAVSGDALDTSPGGNASDPDTGDDANLQITHVANAANMTNQTIASGGSATIMGLYGALMIAADGTYTYELYNTSDPEGGLLNALRHDEVVNETFEFTVSDGNGGQDTANLVFTVVGTNDDPVVGNVAGSVQEDTDVDGSGNLTDSGSIVIGDVDDGDSHSATPLAHSNLGIFTAEVNAVTGEVDWTYSIDNSLTQVQQLGVGESFTETFQIEVSDGVGTTISTVDITVNGTNDTPTIDAISGVLTEGDIAGGHTINVLNEGSAQDVDQNDTIDLTGITGGLELLLNSAGGVDIDINVQTLIDSGLVSFATNGEVTISSDFTDAINQMMQDGDSLTVDAEVTIQDNSGAANDTATGDIDLTVMGADAASNASPEGSNYGIGTDQNGDPYDMPDFLIPTFDENGSEGGGA